VVTRHLGVLIGTLAASCVAGTDPTEELAVSTTALPIASVSASGAETGNSPANAIDGSLATRWSCNGAGSWIQADLGSVQPVAAASLAWYLGDQRTTRFAVSLSQDGATFSEVFAGSSSGTTTNLERYGFAATNARYVRIVVDGNSENTWASLTEIGRASCRERV